MASSASSPPPDPPHLNTSSGAEERDPTQTTMTDQPTLALTIKFTAESASVTWSFPEDATLDELLVQCADTWPAYDWDKSKVLPERRRGLGSGSPAPPTTLPALLKAQTDDAFPLQRLGPSTTLKLLAPKHTDLDALHEASAAVARRAAVLARRRRYQAPASLAARRDQRRAAQDAEYTFHTVRPLLHLPGSERSRAFLERLKADAGIRAVMRQHKFSVGLLTEMDPAQYTESNHEGTTRILGLNRNKGEVIELRLRTDAGDGYRDYGTIRKTLCHELTHNVHGPHDADFWALCKQIEKEVLAGDWKSGGRSVADEDFAPSRGDEEDVMDHGGWTGGEFVLGGSGSGESSRGLSRRDIMARAAEQRVRDLNKAKSTDKDPDKTPDSERP